VTVRQAVNGTRPQTSHCAGVFPVLHHTQFFLQLSWHRAILLAQCDRAAASFSVLSDGVAHGRKHSAGVHLERARRRIKANAAIVPAGTNGAIRVFATDDTDLILDINGYFVPATTPSALAFYSMPPCRVVDSRINLLTSGALTAGVSRTLPILSSTCNVPSTAQAHSLNFTAVPPGPFLYLSVWPTGQPQPTVSTLNDLPGTIVANAAIVPAGTSGSIDVYASGATDLIVDINGYFAPPAAGGLSLYNLPPCRVIDTRNPPGSTFTGQLDVNVIGSGCGGTNAAQAYVLNARVIPSGELIYLTLWAQGATQPTVSTLNAIDGAITNNMAIVPTNNTEISAYSSGPAATYLLLDMSGYFAP